MPSNHQILVQRLFHFLGEFQELCLAEPDRETRTGKVEFRQGLWTAEAFPAHERKCKGCDLCAARIDFEAVNVFGQYRLHGAGPASLSAAYARLPVSPIGTALHFLVGIHTNEDGTPRVCRVIIALQDHRPDPA